MNQINLALSVEQINIILMGLSELPLKISGDLFTALKQEATKQIEEQTKATQEVKGKKASKNTVEK